MLGFIILSLNIEYDHHIYIFEIFLLVMNYMIDRQSFVNVLNHLNVVEYFRPYFVILLLDVILLKGDVCIVFHVCLFIYLHHLMEQIHDQQVHDQLLYM
jgi:hypothetical protein